MLWLTALPAAAEPEPVASRIGQRQRFDHDLHAERVPRCDRCHRLDARRGWEPRGRIGHWACSSSGCHAIEESSRPGRVQPPLCDNCHIDQDTFWDTDLRRGESGFVLARFDHGDHQRVGGRGCEQCHVSARPPARAGPSPEFGVVGHETCGQSICHGDRIEPRMTDCEACHVRRTGDGLASMTSDAYRVAWGYSHAAHHKAAGAVACAACHVDTAVDPGAVVPLPPMAACGACHDGGGAFAVTGTKCGVCHQPPVQTDAR